jgi:serine/threonine-protein kinase
MTIDDTHGAQIPPAPERFVLGSVVAEEGCTTVHVAEDTLTGGEVTLRTLTRTEDPTRYQAQQDQFLREGEMHRRSVHPNVVALLEEGLTPRGAFQAFEAMHGPTLGDVLADGPVSVSTAAVWMYPVCAALGAAHARGVVHGTVSPSSLVFVRDGTLGDQLKVRDFGAHLRPGFAEAVTAEDAPADAPCCLAPEQIGGGAMGPWTDVYALGVVLFRMVTGRFPMIGDTTTGTMLAHLEDAIPHVRDHAPVPPAFDALIQRCLAKDPRHRFLTATSIARALESWTPVRRRISLDPSLGLDPSWLTDAPDDLDDLDEDF